MQDDDELSRPIGGVIEDVYITAPVSRGGDGITVYGSDGPVVIRNCTVDLGRWPLDKLDEGLSGVDGARAVIRRTRVTRVGKASASRCWTNRWWIRLQGHRGPRMSKREALALMAELEGRLL